MMQLFCKLISGAALLPDKPIAVFLSARSLRYSAASWISMLLCCQLDSDAALCQLDLVATLVQTR